MLGDEGGFALLDAVMSILLLLVLLVPIGGLLITTNKVVHSTLERQQAQTIAVGILNQEETAANQNSQGTTTTAGLDPPFLYGASLSTGTWPNNAGSSPADPTTMNVDGELYTAWVVGGWCQLHQVGSSSVYSWGNYDSTAGDTNMLAPNAYFVAVKVAWGQQAKSTSTGSVSIVKAASVATGENWVGSRSVSDLSTTSGQPTVSSNSAAFTSADIGKYVIGDGIPQNTTITAINTIVAPATSTTGATLSKNATATANASAKFMITALAPTTAECPNGLS